MNRGRKKLNSRWVFLDVYYIFNIILLLWQIWTLQDKSKHIKTYYSSSSKVDFWGKLKNRSLYFYDLIRSKMSRKCILSVTELSYYYICHFYKIHRICSYAEAAFIKTIAVFTVSTYWKDVFITFCSLSYIINLTVFCYLIIS